jgi:hypothetical protein
MKRAMPIFLRAHTEPAKPRWTPRKPDDAATDEKAPPPKWPEYALVFDCETTIDECQKLTLGAYQFCRANSAGVFECLEEGLFYPDELPTTDPDGMELLRCYVKEETASNANDPRQRLRLLNRSEFMEEVFWKAAKNAEALLVGFNLPFDLSRLALDNREARRRNEVWSLVMFEDNHPDTGDRRENPFRPRIIITPKDSKTAFIRFAGVSKRSKVTKQRLIPYTPGRFLDLRTLGWALRNESYSLQTACEAFGVPGKLDHRPTGRISDEEVAYCRQDVQSTLSLLNTLRVEFDRHPVDLQPERAYSPASIVKAYLGAMGVMPPQAKFDFSPLIMGWAMQAYYGGRVEVRIRKTLVPTILTDFMSEYPTVNTLMDLWPMLRARQLGIAESTDDVLKLLASLTLEKVLDQSFWKNLAFFALVQPDGDILPVRTTYSGLSSNIGINPLTSKDPIWYAGPDLVAATLLTGRPPAILRAIRLEPSGQQPDLEPVSLRGMIDIDPARDDFFKVAIEARARVRSDQSFPKKEREALAYFLKILANAGSYGLFVEVNPAKVGCDAKTGKPARAQIHVYSGEKPFATTSPVIEELGVGYFPPFGALITAGGRLLLALLERLVTDAGGNYLFCDTDSMAIVASRSGGFVACAGGPHRLPDGEEAIKVLSRSEVEGIVQRIDRLNPYDRSVVTEPILKIEKVNFDPSGKPIDLVGFGIASKRYSLATKEEDGKFKVRKASAHGLGFLYAPKTAYDSDVDAPEWVREAWEWILAIENGVPAEMPPWFDMPAMMRFTITTPKVLAVLQQRQKNLPYSERTKPLNFIQSPVIDRLTGGCPVDTDRDRFTLIAPFSSNPSDWLDREYINVHDGKSYELATREKRLNYQAEAKTYGDIVAHYRWHAESKSLGPDGNTCTSQSRGLLRRTPVTANELRYIGKETDRRWEQGEDISILDTFTLEYRPDETENLKTDPDLQRKAREHSIRAIAEAAGLSTRTVKAARDGKRLRKHTIDKLTNALNSQPVTKKPDKPACDPPFTLDD